MEGKEKNKRFSTNVVNLLVTCVFLFFAVQFSDGGGGFATKITRITENLDLAVSNLDGNISYSDYNDTSVYSSSTKFHSKGMAGLYNLTNMFIDIIVPDDILMEGFISIDSNNGIIINQEPNIKDTLHYYRKLFALLIFLVLCILLFPFCGICFCCCRCCGNCGARSQPADKKKDTCKKIIQGTLLIVFGTGLLFCVVCAFCSNQQLQDGLEDFPDNMRTSIKDTNTFLDATSNQVQYLLEDNYREFEKEFSKTMDNSSEIVTDQLNTYSNATAMTELYFFTKNIEKINTTLTSLKDNSNKLRVYASQLNDALRKVKRDLLNTLNDCEAVRPECAQIKNNVSRLQTNIDFNGLPDVNSDLESLNKLKIAEIKNAAAQGQEALDDIKIKIKDALDTGINSAKEQIDATSQTITKNMNSVKSSISDIKSQIDSNTSPAIKKAEEYISEYGKYRYYVGLAISCVLLLVTICIALGLICGVCGKRPDGYSDNCCNKGAGSQFLLCAVMIMFFFGFVISVITVISIVVGVVSEKAICDPIQNPDPEKYRIIQLLDSFDLNLDVKIKPSELLQDCYQNKSVYHTFKLESKFNLAEIKKKFNIDAQLEKLTIDGSIFDGFTILSYTNYNILSQLLDFTPNADLTRFQEELSDEFTNYSLTDLSQKLEDIISKLQSNVYDDIKDIKAQLQLSVLHLNTYNEKLLVPMKSLANEVMDNALQLHDDLKMGKGSFQEAISDLINETKKAEKYLKTKGPEQLTQVSEKFKVIIKHQIDSYIDRVSDQIENKIGLCGPLSLVVNGTLTSTCSKVLLPWNGFWFSLFWTIILYVLVIVISIKLANLYQKYKPYGPYVETEYLYDAYADRGDSIPLNSRGAKRGKKKGKKSKRYEDRPVVASEVAREYPAGSRPTDARYADMAPKHWEEFPNGGPPHYQRAPTEYERPPPYYYPGSGGEQ